MRELINLMEKDGLTDIQVYHKQKRYCWIFNRNLVKVTTSTISFSLVNYLSLRWKDKEVVDLAKSTYEEIKLKNYNIINKKFR